MPIPQSVEQHYGVPPEDYWKKEYFAVGPLYMKGQLTRFETLAKRDVRSSHMTALDVGAGIGKAMIALAHAGFDVYGIEPAQPFYSRAIEIMHVPQEKLTRSTIEEAEFDENRFDFINMGAVLEHLYDPSAVIRKALAWLRPGGFIHIEVPSAGYLMSRLARMFYRASGSDYVINTCPMHVPYHLYEFTPASFERHAATYHYRVAFHEYYACDSYLPGPLNALFQMLMSVSKTGMQLAIWLTK
jgi:SAM-dependent methyltransferase